MKLDEVDVKILEHMQKNARLSFRDLAKKIGVSTPTVSSKVKLLESIGLIKGYRAEIKTSLLNETLIFFLIRTRPADIGAVAKRLKKMELIRAVYLTTESKLLVITAIPSSQTISTLVSKFEDIPEVEGYETYHIVDVLKDEPKALITKGLALTLSCFYCKKTIHDEPVVLKLDGREHYMCCNTCAREYKKKYFRLKEKI